MAEPEPEPVPVVWTPPLPSADGGPAYLVKKWKVVGTWKWNFEIGACQAREREGGDQWCLAPLSRCRHVPSYAAAPLQTRVRSVATAYTSPVLMCKHAPGMSMPATQGSCLREGAVRTSSIWTACRGVPYRAVCVSGHFQSGDLSGFAHRSIWSGS